MKRITIFKNGSKTDPKVLLVPASLSDLLDRVSQKLGISATILFTCNGAEIDDIDLIRDDDTLYASEGSAFIDTTSPQLPVSLRQNHVRSSMVLPKLQELKIGGTESNWVTLNVGGKHFTTTRSTLTSKEPTSMLARMFANEGGNSWGSSVDSKGAYLIDRSPIYFEPILNYLRHGELIIDPSINTQGVLEEAKFFGIISLIPRLEKIIQAEKRPDDGTPITRRELILSLMTTPTNKELRCQGLNFSGAQLHKLDLRYINFKYANLQNVNFSCANISYCNFERADIANAVLDGANLLGVKMLCANMEGASMKGCNFEDPAGSRANMEGAIMKGVNLEGSRMAGVNLRVANLKNSNLQNCDLRGAVLAGADLENCDLSGCDLQEANLRGANLKDAAFELMLNPLHMSQAVR
ncbi:unnamed protein product [Owenia fusiformis]|uniref:BTB/POZ domain-containing protein KCTD9 n=1 Tax=Owenia fusiformis TaxID=6347 RepID=A0A8S4NRR4_OWEFU|nr:unnamed protein product [Owenia fusiformis]